MANKSYKPNKQGNTQWQPDIPDRAYRLCLMGLTNRELADAFGVKLATIDNWMVNRDKFRQKVHAGREQADEEVAKALYHRAKGYKMERTYVTFQKGGVIEHKYEEEVPPDTRASIFWLKNRQRDKWSDRVENEVSGKNGEPIQTRNMNANMDTSGLDNDEVRQLIELGIKVNDKNQDDEGK